jgi:hypothetical protein
MQSILQKGASPNHLRTIYKKLHRTLLHTAHSNWLHRNSTALHPSKKDYYAIYKQRRKKRKHLNINTPLITTPTLSKKARTWHTTRAQSLQQQESLWQCLPPRSTVKKPPWHVRLNLIGWSDTKIMAWNRRKRKRKHGQEGGEGRPRRRRRKMLIV